MIFNIPEGTIINKDLFAEAIHNYYYGNDKGYHPEYCLLHPSTEHKFAESLIEPGYYQYEAIEYFNPLQNKDKDDGTLPYVKRFRNVSFIRSVDVKPDLFIVCGN